MSSLSNAGGCNCLSCLIRNMPDVLLPNATQEDKEVYIEYCIKEFDIVCSSILNRMLEDDSDYFNEYIDLMRQDPEAIHSSRYAELNDTLSTLLILPLSEKFTRPIIDDYITWGSLTAKQGNLIFGSGVKDSELGAYPLGELTITQCCIPLGDNIVELFNSMSDHYMTRTGDVIYYDEGSCVVVSLSDEELVDLAQQVKDKIDELREEEMQQVQAAGEVRAALSWLHMEE